MGELSWIEYLLGIGLQPLDAVLVVITLALLRREFLLNRERDERARQEREQYLDEIRVLDRSRHH